MDTDYAERIGLDSVMSECDLFFKSHVNGSSHDVCQRLVTSFLRCKSTVAFAADEKSHGMSFTCSSIYLYAFLYPESNILLREGRRRRARDGKREEVLGNEGWRDGGREGRRERRRERGTEGGREGEGERGRRGGGEKRGGGEREKRIEE